ncbi:MULTISPECIES: HNH endonuclease signature motif containing protein [Mogibacterium]|uniref:HNH endonuclease signature motif containing protein n=1 Tax=Mogibacterium TaxID=86331 RepID=UPI0017FD4C70|nr:MULTISPECIES: hypothetical protein [Mogibacterium]MBB1533054.1 HNH endonuclease [Mogibacterium sp.]
MIEKLAKTIESVGKPTEKQPDNKFDPDKRVNFEQDKVDKKVEDKGFDPDKRIEVPGAEANATIEGVDKTELLEKNVDAYIKDVKAGAEYPETVKNINLDASQLKDVPENIYKKRQAEFKKIKPKLIKEFEEKHGIKYPRHTKDYYLDGKLIHKKGDLYDVHHIKPLCLGGENTIENITPMGFKAHYDKHGIHAPNSAFDNMCKLVKGEV